MEPGCVDEETGPERVYRWTPNDSGPWIIETCGSGTNFDTVLHLRRGSCTNQGAEVDCDDDSCAIDTSSRQGSQLFGLPIPGETYFIIVDGFGGASGDYRLTVRREEPPPTPCTTACDCPDGFLCASGECLSGIIPRYCCEGFFCPAGEQCEHVFGGLDVCPGEEPG